MTKELAYVKDTGLTWPKGKSERKEIDHIQLHHTVGNYGTPRQWKSLHERRIADGQKGVSYSYLVLQSGEIYLGRGLTFAHGGVKDSETTNERGVGANQRSVAIALDGDMRKDHLPADKQLAAAVRLVQDILAHYGKLPILGHNEIPTYKNRKPTGKTYPTACPCLDMDNFRALVAGAPMPAPEPAPEYVPDADPDIPGLYVYAGATYSNVRSGPGTKYGTVGKVSAGEIVHALDAKADEKYIWYLLRRVDAAGAPASGTIGWCTSNYLKAVE